jgi:hypothetical protein
MKDSGIGSLVTVQESAQAKLNSQDSIKGRVREGCGQLNLFMPFRLA